MPLNKICLASDNWAPAHPLILTSVLEANEGYAPSYGADHWTEQAQRAIKNAFKTHCKIFIMPNGTGSNVLALKLSCRRHESVICTDISHIHYQEAGAAESIVGCKLLTVPHMGGKITVESIIKKLRSERAFGKHSTTPRVVSIAQPTEVGTIYRLDELKSLSEFCQAEKLLLHIDGSRIFNAAARLKCSLHEIVQVSQADILSLGGTKNGLMGAEALLIFNHELEVGSDHIQKQTLQLTSKMRFLSAQYIPLFKDNLWETLAIQANQRAQEISSIITEIPRLSLSYPVETNQIFFTGPSSWIPLIQERIFCYPWDLEKNEIRFITSWNTSKDEIKSIRAIFEELSSQH